MKVPNGSIFQISSSTALTEGDSVKIDSESLHFEGMANSVPSTRNEFATVKKDLEDSVLVEINGTTQSIWNPNNISVERGVTVEISDTGIVSDVFPDVDPSLSLFERDNDSLIKSFREDKPEDKDDDDILSFSDFGGMTIQQNQFRERVELFLEDAEALREVGTEPRMGALFYGPPGTGKTHFAQILSDSLEAQFYRIRGPEIVSKGVGDTEKLIRDIFDDAVDESPSIIFFDEIDSIAGDRGGSETRDFSQRIVAQLLSIIDGFDRARKNVFVIAATNQINEIDAALRRSGRFDWEVHFPEPDSEQRRQIFESLREEYKISESVSEDDISQILSRTEGWTGAKLRKLLNEAGALCVIDGHGEIRHSHLLKAHERVQQEETNQGGI
ncbi:ATP-binding protein [Halobacterium sp. KA-6]|uniref:ATP-binding protein n=1 Tax=Halobacterium sp. KA-6 TaxID=2896368 RepID=UPI001E4B48F9|nr:AAA family ATPase [Halobacterium sp. KA-6]MCD2202685.1 AAA family ATPase [Halobacterium sp. KA-6]